MSSSDLVVIDSDSDVEEVQDLPDVLVGSGEYEIVGIRYYSGVAHPGEFVTLVREPHNREWLARLVSFCVIACRQTTTVTMWRDDAAWRHNDVTIDGEGLMYEPFSSWMESSTRRARVRKGRGLLVALLQKY